MYAVIDAARERDLLADAHLAPSTVHRLLAREGLLEKNPEQPATNRRRFSYRLARELWMSNVMDGPVPDGRHHRRKNTHYTPTKASAMLLPFPTLQLPDPT